MKRSGFAVRVAVGVALVATGAAVAVAQEAPAPQGAEATAPATVWLVWTSTDAGTRTDWLADDGTAEGALLSSAPGLYVAHAGAIWQIGEVADRATSWDPSCVDASGSYESPPDACALPTVVVSAAANELGGEGSLRLHAPPVAGGAACELDYADTVVASLGPYVFVDACEYVYACGAAHGSTSCSQAVLNVAAQEVSGVESVRDVPSDEAATAALAWDAAQSSGVTEEWFATDASALTHVATRPGWRDDGRLQVRLQYAGEACYACDNGGWTSYTMSVEVPTDEVPALLRPYRHVPAVVRSRLTTLGAWPDGRFGFSQLR